MIRPGPESITPRAHPGGVVVHIYSPTVPPLLLMVRRYGPADDIEAAAVDDAGIVGAYLGGAPVCLVAFDGDTGARFTAADWLRRPG